jgi:hypothetical protein
MMARGIVRKVQAAQQRVERSITDHRNSAATDAGRFFARGLPREGYAGGYSQALSDVLLALNGVEPATAYWHDDKDK